MEINKINQKQNFKNLSLGTHIALIFDDDNEKNQRIIQFMKQQLNNNLKLFYFLEEAHRKNFEKLLNDNEKDLNSAEILVSSPVSLFESNLAPDVSVDPDMIFNLLEKHANLAISEGCSGLVVIEEMDWVIGRFSNSKVLMDFEEKTNKITQNFPIIWCCIYKKCMFRSRTIFDIMKTHEHIMLKWNLVKNPYYISPDIYVKTQKVYPLKIYKQLDTEK